MKFVRWTWDNKNSEPKDFQEAAAVLPERDAELLVHGGRSFSKKYMILSYSFGDHSSHQSSTHPRLRSKSAAKFVCRQELACAAPASAVAAAVQPASASLPPLTLTPPSPCYFWAKRQRSTCKKELSSICFVNSTSRATKAVIADWVALEDESVSEEEEEEEEEDGDDGEGGDYLSEVYELF